MATTPITTPDGESAIEALATETLGALAIDSTWFRDDGWEVVAPNAVEGAVLMYGPLGEDGARTLKVRLSIESASTPQAANPEGA